MKPSRLTLTCLLTLLMTPAALARSGPADSLQIPIFSASSLTQHCARALEVAKDDFDSLARIPLKDARVQTVLQAWDTYSARLEDVLGPVYILTYTHPDKAVRDAGEACIVKITAFETELFQNVALYGRVKAVSTDEPIDAKFRQDLLNAFQDTGVDLPLEKRLRAKQILDQIQALSQEFNRNLRENKDRVYFLADEQKGLPPSYLERVKRLEDGRIEVGFDYPDYVPFMRYAEDGVARERYYRAFSNRGGKRNLEILDEVVALRKELAELHDMDSYAELVTLRKMVGNPDTVLDFLDEVEDVVTEVEEKEISTLVKLKAEQQALPAQEARLYPWDKELYLERLRKARYDIDQQALRKYFPSKATLGWVLDLSSQLYGIEFKPAMVPVWHSEVLYYKVYNRGESTPIGALYLDLYPREGKYGHAAAFPIRGSSTRLGRKPVTALVTNFDRKGLTQSEVETLLHEFGHALHGVLSNTRYVNHAGTQVERDFVEAPSQMYEAWARDPSTLALMQKHCRDCPTIDPELAARLEAARMLGQGLLYARQWLYASYDMELAGDDPEGAMQVWREMEDDTALGFVEGTEFPGTFAHILGGYAAGYYGYMWSEVIALDMLSAFGNNLLNPPVGLAFREKILSRGAEKPAAEMVQEFLGRAPSSTAFFNEIRGIQTPTNNAPLVCVPGDSVD